jgi:nitrogen fixation NifU-like protein
MSEELYHQRLVARARAARGKGRLAAPDASATVDNPLCGDRVTIEVKLRDGRIVELAHQTRGCLLCEAAAALIGELAPGETPEALRSAGVAATALLDGAEPPAGRWAALAEFAPVRAVRSRRDCVLLPFEALAKALAAATAPK